MDLVTEEMVNKLRKAADKLEQAAQYTAMTEGLGLAELTIALNNYHLAKVAFNQEINKRYEEYENYMN